MRRLFFILLIMSNSVFGLTPDERANEALAKMDFQQKVFFVGGYKDFFIASLPVAGLRSVYLTDASSGMRIRGGLFKMDKSIAYPSTVALAATWDPQLAYRYGAAISGECRGWGADVLLGPGVNIYRNSMCGRNFEYMGEDPFLVGIIACEHIKGVQSNGVVATGKHFICNNHEWLRHTSDVRIDDRAFREIYARAWYRMIHSGNLGAIMTSYNLVNGEKASSNRWLITDFLREEIGFTGLIMTDWWASTDMKKTLYSGHDLIMPFANLSFSEKERVEAEKFLDKMVFNILKTGFKFGYYDRDSVDKKFLNNYSEYESVALDTARKSITLLKNNEGLLPLSQKGGNIIVTGSAAEFTPHSAGGYVSLLSSGYVKGYDHKHIFAELKKSFPDRVVEYKKDPNIDEIKNAETVIVCVHTFDGEYTDRDFNLQSRDEKLILKLCRYNKNIVVAIISGGAVRVVDWKDKVNSILHLYYAGQYGGKAFAEIVSGKISPSGKLPFTMEKEFSDSPAFNYKPRGAGKKERPVLAGDYVGGKFPKVDYSEGIFVGYRYYEKRGIDVAYSFGHGISYTKFNYKNLSVKKSESGLVVSVEVENTGKVRGDEVVQFYYADIESSVPRPKKELCGFKRVSLESGEKKELIIDIPYEDLSFYSVQDSKWKTESGEYALWVGSSSADIRLKKDFKLDKDLFYKIPVPKKG